MTNTLPPSSIARQIANQQWPGVQRQTKLAPGTFDFSCAGHGGVVALVELTDIPASAVEVARKHGLLLEYAEVHDARGRRVFTSRHVAADEWQRWKTEYALSIKSEGLAWVGEEDVDWATIFTASPAAVAGKNKVVRRPGYLSGDVQSWIDRFGSVDYARDVVRRWNEQFLIDLDATADLPVAQV